eukprot:2769162-Rhodomonas_salina.5
MFDFAVWVDRTAHPVIAVSGFWIPVRFASGGTIPPIAGLTCDFENARGTVDEKHDKNKLAVPQKLCQYHTNRAGWVHHTPGQYRRSDGACVGCLNHTSGQYRASHSIIPITSVESSIRYASAEHRIGSA